MRVAIISDIHGNGVALRKVLKSIDTRNIDKIVCLGDICYGGPEPAECLNLIRNRVDFCVLGNTDEVILKYKKFNQNIEPSDELIKWTAESLNDDDIEYINSLPLNVRITLGNNIDITAFHGSTTSTRDILSIDDLVSLSEKGSQRILYIGGHTHKVFASYIGLAGLLNPGSVGFNTIITNEGKKMCLPIANFIVIDTNDQLSVEFIQIEFSLEEYKLTLEGSKIPNKERLIERWRIDK